MISALVFVPPKKTLEEFDNLLFYFEHLQNINEKFFIFAEWFKSNYISNSVGKDHSTVFWRTYNWALTNLPFTNNSLEAYNRHLNNVSETTHPSLYSLLSELKKETELSFIEIEIATFNRNPSNTDQIKKYECVNEYGSLVNVNHLKKVAYSVKFCFDV